MRYRLVIDHDPDPDLSWLDQGDKANHVSLWVRLYKLGIKDQDWTFVDSIGGVDFLADQDDWATGTFYRVTQVPKGYLRQLARELGMR